MSPEEADKLPIGYEPPGVDLFINSGAISEETKREFAAAVAESKARDADYIAEVRRRLPNRASEPGPIR